MSLGFLLLFSIGKSGAILTIYMALHQVVKTTGKNIENRPPFPESLPPPLHFWSPNFSGGQLGNNREIIPMVSQPSSLFPLSFSKVLTPGPLGP
jgi:hypothetical protein